MNTELEPLDALADARAAGVERVINTLATVALDACKDDEARAYIRGLSGEAGAAMAELIEAARRTAFALDLLACKRDRNDIDPTVRAEELRAALARVGGAS